MVQRTEIQNAAPQIGAVQMVGSQIGNKAPDVDKFATESAQGAGSDGFLVGLLKAVVPAASRYAQVREELSKQDAYLNGASAAATGKAEAEVESNPLTRDWATAGYRDTATKVLAAQAEAANTLDAAKFKHLSPKEFADKVKARRTEISGDVASMSRDARERMFGQQLTHEQAVIAQHGKLHQQWIMDEDIRAKQLNVSSSMLGLDTSKGNGEAYTAAANATFVTLYNETFGSKTIVRPVQQKLLGEAMEVALQKNHIVLYDKLRSVRLPDEDGKERTLFERLPFEQQQKLSKMYDQSMNDTANVRNQEYAMNLGIVRAGFDDTQQPMIEMPALKALLDEGIQLGHISPEKEESITKEWAEARIKRNKEGNPDLVAAFRAQDDARMMRAGGNDSEGAEAYVKSLARQNMSPEQMVTAVLTTMETNGSPALRTQLAKLLAPSVANMWLPNAEGATRAQQVATVMASLDKAESTGAGGQFSTFLSGFAEDDRKRLLQFRAKLSAYPSPVLAAKAVADDMAAEQKMGGAAFSAVKSQQDIKEDIDAVKALDVKRSSLWRYWDKAWAAVGVGQATSAAKTYTGLFEDDNRTAEATASYTRQMNEELAYQRNVMPMADAKSRMAAAEAALYERTIQTKGQPLTLPRMLPGQTVQDYFRVSQSTTKEVIGEALDSLHTPHQSGNRVMFKAVGDTLQWEEFNKDGQRVFGGQVVPAAVRGAVDHLNVKKQERVMATDGTGVTFKGTDGYTVQFNGAHALSGVTTDDMFEFRKTLVQNEGATGKAITLKDTQGKPVTVAGVGLTKDWLPKPKQDGSYDHNELNRNFMKASEQAMGAGHKIALTTGLGTKARPLFAELAYQSGPGFASKSYYKDFMQAMVTKDKAKAVSEFKQSKAWQDSRGPRRSHYLNLINKALE